MIPMFVMKLLVFHRPISCSQTVVSSEASLYLAAVETLTVDFILLYRFFSPLPLKLFTFHRLAQLTQGQIYTGSFDMLISEVLLCRKLPWGCLEVGSWLKVTDFTEVSHI